MDKHSPTDAGEGSAEHTPGPWRYEEYPPQVLSEDYCIAVSDDTGEYSAPGNQPEANARRIVACVNYCAGVPNEILKDSSAGGDLNSLIASINELRAERGTERARNEALVDALEEITDAAKAVAGAGDILANTERQKKNLMNLNYCIGEAIEALARAALASTESVEGFTPPEKPARPQPATFAKEDYADAFKEVFRKLDSLVQALAEFPGELMKKKFPAFWHSAIDHLQERVQECDEAIGKHRAKCEQVHESADAAGGQNDG